MGEAVLGDQLPRWQAAKYGCCKHLSHAGWFGSHGYERVDSAIDSDHCEHKSKLFAEALAVIYEYQELPYRIRRRASSDGCPTPPRNDEGQAAAMLLILPLARAGNNWLSF